MEAQIACDHFMAVSPQSCILAIGAADVGSLLLLVQYGPLWANKYFW
jgi:hypothetical protein